MQPVDHGYFSGVFYLSFERAIITWDYILKLWLTSLGDLIRIPESSSKKNHSKLYGSITSPYLCFTSQKGIG